MLQAIRDGDTTEAGRLAREHLAHPGVRNPSVLNDIPIRATDAMAPWPGLTVASVAAGSLSMG
jgi:hypothetical protein